MAREGLGVDGRRGDDHLEVGPLRQQPLEVAEEEIDVEAALVGLVDDDRPVARQQPVMARLGEEHAVGHELDARFGRGGVGEADLPAYQASQRAEFLGDPGGHRGGGDAPRLGAADDQVPAGKGLPGHLGELRSLPGTGLAGDDDHLVLGEEGEDCLAMGDDRQGFRVKNMHERIGRGR